MPETCPLCEKAPLSSRGVHPTIPDMSLFGCRRCGEFFVSGSALHPLTQRSFDERSCLSAVTRRAWDAGRRVEIGLDDIDRLVDTAPRWTSPFEGVDRLLRLVASRTNRWTGPGEVNKEDDYPLICARGPDEVNDLTQLAWDLGYLVGNKSVLTVEGWRRIDELRERQPVSRQAFVAMWFAKELDEVWENGFKKGIEESKYFRAIRVDTLEYNEKVDDRIVAEIRRSGLLVADFTGNRGGVYFEAGLALGLGIPVIWTCRFNSIDDVHFDTRQYNHIVWGNSDQLRKRLADRISATVLPQGWRAV